MEVIETKIEGKKKMDVDPKEAARVDEQELEQVRERAALGNEQVHRQRMMEEFLKEKEEEM